MSGVMTAARWQQMKVILADALECKTLKERTTLLEQSCEGDTTLLREIETLLAQATGNLDDCVEHSPVSFARSPLSPELNGKRIGAYEIVREIGRGGMGAVYLAKRADGQFEKEVAIKLLKRGTDTDEVLRSLLGMTTAEIEALAERKVVALAT